MSQEDDDAIEMKFMPPLNAHIRRLKDDLRLDSGEKMAADARLSAYYFREGVRAALKLGEGDSARFLSITKSMDPLPADSKRNEPFLTEPSYPWEL